jgi:fumarylpyruvate hydrolase
MSHPPTVPAPSLGIEQGGVFGVRRVYCVAKNYAAHTIEMGGDPKTDPPCFFSKPSDAACNVDSLPYPPMTQNLHHEIEQVVAIGKRGKNISEGDALSYVWGYGVGVDLTRRDIQAEAKKGGRPWDMAKGFDYSAPMSKLVPSQRVENPLKGEIGLKVNGKTVQCGDLSLYTWSIPETIAFLSQYVELFPGDLIMMGTPDGVGPLRPGDEVEGWIEGINTILFTVTETKQQTPSKL